MTLLPAVYPSLCMWWERCLRKPTAKVPLSSQSGGEVHGLISDFREGTLWPGQVPPTLEQWSRVKRGAGWLDQSAQSRFAIGKSAGMGVGGRVAICAGHKDTAPGCLGGWTQPASQPRT